MTWEYAKLEHIKGGQAIIDVNHHIQKAVDDILDPAKPADKARTVTLKIKLSPTDDRQNIGVQYVVEQHFPADSPGMDMIAVRRETGEAFIQTSDQLPLGFDPETGEVPQIRKDLP